MRILHKGKWEKLHEVFKPFYEIGSMTNSTVMEVMPFSSKAWHKEHFMNGCLERLPQVMWGENR